MMLSIILVAFCLRIIITGVGPLLPEITESLGLSGSASGLLTTLPLIAFAVVSPLTGGIGRRLGEGRTVLIGLCLILLGTVLRSTAGILGLFLGTAIVGVGTAIGNVLLPAVVKAEYPTRVGQVTAYFTVAMVAAAAIGLALNVPLSTAGLGWNGALMIWGIAVVITGFIWRKNVSLRLGTTDPAFRHQFPYLLCGHRLAAHHFAVLRHGRPNRRDGHLPVSGGQPGPLAAGAHPGR